jgi:hypothetical protein
VVHLAHVHDDVVGSQLRDKVLLNTRKVSSSSSMNDALGRDVGLIDTFKIPVNDFVVYPAIEIAGLDAVDDLARWCEFLMSSQNETNDRRSGNDSL